MVFLVCCTALQYGCAPVRPPANDQVEQALAASKENAKTGEGAAYDTAVGRAFIEKHANTMTRCTDSAAVSDLQTFDLLMNIREDGRIDEALVRPETKVSLCVREAVRDDTFPAPPGAAYWVHVHMVMTD